MPMPRLKVPRIGRLRPAFAFFGMVVLLSGCAYRGNIDEPVARKFAWFSYMDGADIRAACAKGTANRYRLVYNASYMEQLRSYELTDAAGGGELVARVLEEPDLLRLALDDPQAPWRWHRAERTLDPQALAALRDAFAGDGLFAGAPDGLRLYSGDFFWVAAACVDGEFHFAAWARPSPQFQALAFPALLFGHDRTGMPVNQPRVVHLRERQALSGDRRNDEGGVRFQVQVGADGLGGIAEL